MFRNTDSINHDIHEIVYTELARNRGERTQIVIERDAQTITLMRAILTAHPENLPTQVTVTLKDNQHEFNIQGQGSDQYHLSQLVDTIETRMECLAKTVLDNCLAQVKELLTDHPVILMGLVRGNMATQANDPMIPDANSRFFMLTELLRSCGELPLMQKLYDTCHPWIISDCIFTFGDLQHVLNAFTPESGYREKLLAVLKADENKLKDLMQNQLDEEEAKTKLLQYFPDMRALPQNGKRA